MNKRASFIVGLLLLSVLGTLPTSTGGEIAETSPSPTYPLEHPNGWTHRPVMELFVSLSCPPCMDSADPAAMKLWEEGRDEGGVPYTLVVHHQINGGNGDDIFASVEAKERYEDYSIVGTPQAEFDGGWINELEDASYESYKSDYEESGQRNVKPTELLVWQEFKGDKFTIRVNLTYLGTGFDPIDPDTWTNPVTGDSLDPSIYIYMVEDDALVWSSELDSTVIAHGIQRGMPVSDERPGPIEAGDTWQGVWDFDIPDTINFMAGHKDYDGNPMEGEHPQQQPINPANMHAVVVVHDLDDTEKGARSNPKNLPWAINSATPASTAWDEENAPPEISFADETYAEDGAEVVAWFDDEDGIGSAYVVYNYENATWDGDWIVEAMEVSGEEICDDNGVCYAFGDAHGSVTIPYEGDKDIWYQVISIDGNKQTNSTEIRKFNGKGVNPLAAETNLWAIVGWSGLGIMALVIPLFVWWGRRPYSGSYFAEEEENEF